MTRAVLVMLGCLAVVWQLSAQETGSSVRIGQEVAVPRHLQNEEELKLGLRELVGFGRTLFEANWTDQDGGGRPLSKGTGQPLSDPSRPLRGPRGFNRISGPDANSCQGCHSAPYGISGGNGDFVANSFELADRFDFVTFDRIDPTVGGGTLDEAKRPVSLQTVGNARATPGLFGAGYIEMLARQITEDLQRIRDQVHAGQSRALVSKGLSFGTLARSADGRWDVSRVEGLPEASVSDADAARPPRRGGDGSAPAALQRGKPSLIVRPWSWTGRTVSLREFTNDAYNRNHGMQSVERFGRGTDPDGDRVVNELTRGDITAATIFQATLAVPGRVIPNHPEIERAVLAGERLFAEMGCTDCHRPALPLDRNGWIYSEPNPFNPAGNLRRGEAPLLQVDLSDASLPSPRLAPSGDSGVVHVAAYTDFKLHDLGDPGEAGARRFLTRRLWGVGNQSPHFHHGLFTTMREAILAHGGEAREQARAFQQAAASDRDAVIEFLKSLQVLPPGTKSLVVDEHYRPKTVQR